MTGTLALAEDVYFCVAQGHGVFLDLKRDAYSAVPLAPDMPVAASEAALASSIIEAHGPALAEAGLLVAADEVSHGFRDYLGIARPSGQAAGLLDRRAFGGIAERPGAPPSTMDVFEVLSACRSAAHKLRRWPIQRTVKRVRMRKRNGPRAFGASEVLASHVDRFGRVRPWYPRDYLCLFDSLALLEFLARRGFYPDWIFGVQVQPFAAHCWLQAEGRLLNETLDYASQFTPIMSV